MITEGLVVKRLFIDWRVIMHSWISHLKLRYTQWLVVMLFIATSLSCAGVSTSPDIQCPQPRFTGQAPTSIYNLKSPLIRSNDSLTAGRALYEVSVEPPCRFCHGTKGDGLGPLASQFSVPPRNFTCAETVNGIPDGQLFWIIQNGSSGTNMPSYAQLSEEEIWLLVIYIRQLANIGD